MSASVLDASALLAYVQEEDGAAEVTEALAATATISALNLAEALSKLAERGADPREVVTRLTEAGVLEGLLEVAPLTTEDALLIAELRPQTREYGLSIADRACLALGIGLGLPVITADRRWSELENVAAEVRSIR